MKGGKNYTLLIGLSIGLVIVSISAFIYVNSIPDNVIHCRNDFSECLSNDEFKNEINPIVFGMIGLSFVSMFMFLLLKLYDKPNFVVNNDVVKDD